MDWRGRRGSRNIEDRRGSTGAKAGSIGGVGVIAVLLIGYFFGIDVSPLLQDTGTQSSAPTELTQADHEAGEFVSVTLADTEEVWAQLFRSQLGREYRPATLVLFKGVTQSPCGGASGATGPFYCPADRKAYLDTDFFTVLETRLGAKGEFAAAYVVAHEIAHHVQNELGILGQANQLRQQVSQADSNAISVRIELQADCLSGVWARTAAQKFGTIGRADIEQAVNAARQIGDDTLQKAAGQRPMPHTFTHGTAEQRSRWFVTGLQSGQIATCDTFATDNL
ncbi:MAG: neutral zinc metallopeptidase [Paracoccaceae bacterium]